MKRTFKWDENLTNEEILVELIDFYSAMRAGEPDMFLTKADKHITSLRLREFEINVREAVAAIKVEINSSK